jgi:hypothetical protein
MMSIILSAGKVEHSYENQLFTLEIRVGIGESEPTVGVIIAQ